MTQKNIVTLTMNPTVDKTTYVEEVTPNQKLRCDDPVCEPGGGGINVARAVQRLGGCSTALFPAGGATGDILKEKLREEAVTFRAIPIQEETREQWIVSEKSSSNQFRFGVPGPHLTERDLQEVFEELEEIDPAPDYLVVSGSLPPGVPADFDAQVAAWAHRRRARLIMDAPGQILEKAAQEPIFLIKPNQRELTDVAERAGLAAQFPKAQAEQLVRRRFCENVVVSLGPEGVIFVNKEMVQTFSAPQVQVRSAVGAGDSMVAGIVLSLAQGKPWAQAVRFGLAAGAAAVMTPGTELCRLADTKAIYSKLGSVELATAPTPIKRRPGNAIN